MIYYRLEISKEKPTQFRISVVDEAAVRVNDMRHIRHTEGCVWIGTYVTPDELTAALEPYLLMEESKGTPE